MIRFLLVDLFRLTIWLALLAVIFVPLERWLALRPIKRRRRETVEDLGFYFLSSLIPAVLLAAPLAALVSAAKLVVPGGYYAAVAGLPLGVRLALAFLVGEIGFYWGHRLAHRWPLLWQYHAVHHRPERIDWLVNTRAHPVDFVFERLCGLVPLYLLGLAGTSGTNSLPAILVVLVGTVWGFLLHTNARIRLGPLEHVLSSPHFHHWHHTRGEPIDRNFASMLPLLDWLFGTLHRPKEWPRDYGVNERPAASPVDVRGDLVPADRH
ncbi:Sterol desaturase family protein [Sphingomonas antarctica]|uniref:sterol desaturase family protein n=1 Tax=Sphingomonas antarctica TaxID=2040274 RepID=UPI0039E82C42